MKRKILLSVLLLIALSNVVGAAEPIRLHPDNPHYLLFRGRPTILLTSGEHYGAVLNLDFDYVRYLEELQAKSLNLTRTFSGTYREVPGSFKITDNTLAPRRYLAPWARSGTPGAADGGNKFDLSQFDAAYFARLKDFIAQAGKRGVVVELVLFCTFYDDKLWEVNPMNSRNNINNVGHCPRTEVLTLKHKDLLAVHEAFVRKVVAELKDCDNVYYEICNEPYFAGVADDWQARISATILQTELSFPARHLIAQNIANGKKKIEKPDPNVSIFNFHYATPPDAVEQNWALNKVMADDETGFRGKDDAFYRTEGWDFILAGGAIYSSLDYSFTPAHPAGTLKEFASPGGGGGELRNQLRILKDFISDFDFIHMRPMNSLIRGGMATSGLGGTPVASKPITVRVLADPGKAYAIYVRGGNQVNIEIELPASSYKAEWINPKTGAVEKSAAFTHLGSIRKIVSPAYTADIALRIKSAPAPAAKP